MDVFQTVLADDTKRDTDGLSDRQAQCLALASKGMTSKEIAREIGISPSTVDNHLRVATMRLGARNRREATKLFRDSRDLGRDGQEGSSPEQGANRPDRVLAIFRLPPLGGSPNRYSVRQRLWLVAQIALMGTMMFAAIAFTISGVVQILGR